jgi:hypothetical protein
MELQFYWYEINPGEDAGHYWGQLAGSMHRLHVIADELDQITEGTDISLALTRLAYHIENYHMRVYELRERLVSLIMSIANCSKSTAGKLKKPTERARAIATLRQSIPNLTQSLSRLLILLDNDIDLRNQHTHDTFWRLGLFTGNDIYDPDDALLDLTEQSEAKAELEAVLRGEIERLIEKYKNKINVVLDDTWKVLEAARGFIKY